MHKKEICKKIIRKTAITAGFALLIGGMLYQGIPEKKVGTRYELKTLKTERVEQAQTTSALVNDSLAQLLESAWLQELEARRARHVLVNKENALPEDYEVKLIRLPDGRHRAAEEAYEPLCRMLNEAAEQGIHLKVCSSYRDAAYQKRLFDEDVAKYMRRGYSYQEAYDKTARLTMPPGHSEHSTGLTFDIVSAHYQGLTAKQEKTEENQWLQAHCAEYGFILRYPKDKVDITKINYESWHFRYVGVEAATYIMQNGITLEEYLWKLPADMMAAFEESLRAQAAAK